MPFTLWRAGKATSDLHFCAYARHLLPADEYSRRLRMSDVRAMAFCIFFSFRAQRYKIYALFANKLKEKMQKNCCFIILAYFSGNFQVGLLN